MLPALRTALAARPQAVLAGARRWGSHAAGGTGYGSGPYRGLKIPQVAGWHQQIGTGMGTIMWLWLFYRCKEDGPALLVRPARPEPPRDLRSIICLPACRATTR
jgi:hypothetical protein